MKKTFTDQLGNIISINFPPRKIISIVPSQTELLFDFGLNEEVIGVTKFCLHPKPKFLSTTKIGGTKKLNLRLIEELKPDLIIGNKEENSKDDILYLQERFPVWMSDIYGIEDAMETITLIGELVNKEPEAAYLNHLINAGFRDLGVLAAENGLKKRVAYLIWKKPYMAAGKNTFIDSMLSSIGLINVVDSPRYPEIQIEDLENLNCDLILLSSEPYPFKQQHIKEINKILPNTEVKLVDGEMFSWYGSRMVKAVQYFFNLQKELF